MGTSVISGNAAMLVCRTGARTALGNLAGTLATQRAPDAFEIGVRRFGLLILRLTVLLVLFVLVANVLFHRPWLELLLFALALAVGLTPELLPMVVTVTLAGGAKRLAARKVIVKRLAAIHDLGAMDVLCTDKTGTLTEARIKVVRNIDARGVESDRVLELAYLNSFFESGIKSPLDDAILDRGRRRSTGGTSWTRCPSTSSGGGSRCCCSTAEIASWWSRERPRTSCGCRSRSRPSRDRRCRWTMSRSGACSICSSVSARRASASWRSPGGRSARNTPPPR